MDKSKIEAAYNDTFSGLTMYYRDCNLSEALIAKYQVNQIIMERGFTDVSSFAEGLSKNLRYAIASNCAVNMGQINPDVAKFGFHLIAAPSYYKVLDIYTVGQQTQILLLNFNEEHRDIFEASTSNIEEQVIAMGREGLNKKIQMSPNDVLNGEEWAERTQFPIGMSDRGDFFLSDTTDTPQTPITPELQTPNTASKITAPEKTKSFWKRLFGK